MFRPRKPLSTACKTKDLRLSELSRIEDVGIVPACNREESIVSVFGHMLWSVVKVLCGRNLTVAFCS